MAGLFLLDASGVIAGMNPAAKRLVEEHPKLVSPERRLALGGVETHPEGPLREAEGPDGSAWKMWVTLVENGTAGTCCRAVVLYPRMRAMDLDLSGLERRFCLTKAEARLARQVLAGLRPAEAAKALGVTVFTVRTYLKRLFHKFGVNNQAGLVRALLDVLHESQFSG